MFQSEGQGASMERTYIVSFAFLDIDHWLLRRRGHRPRLPLGHGFLPPASTSDSLRGSRCGDCALRRIEVVKRVNVRYSDGHRCAFDARNRSWLIFSTRLCWTRLCCSCESPHDAKILVRAWLGATSPLTFLSRLLSLIYLDHVL
jgi:hypothetical protein